MSKQDGIWGKLFENLKYTKSFYQITRFQYKIMDYYNFSWECFSFLNTCGYKAEIDENLILEIAFQLLREIKNAFSD